MEDNRLEEEVLELRALVVELKMAQGELLTLLDRETGITVRVNGTGRTTSMEVPVGTWLFMAFDRHTGEMLESKEVILHGS